MPTEVTHVREDQRRLLDGRFDAHVDDETLLDVVAELARVAREDEPERVSQPAWDRALAESRWRGKVPTARGVCMRLSRRGRKLSWAQVVAMALKAGAARRQTLVASSRVRERRALTEHHVFYAVRLVARDLGHEPATPAAYDAATDKLVDASKRQHRYGVDLAERLPTANQLTNAVLAGRETGPNYWDDVLRAAGYDIVPAADVATAAAGEGRRGSEPVAHQRVEWALVHFARHNGKWPSARMLRAFAKACDYKLGRYTKPFADYFEDASQLMEATGVAVPTESMRSTGGRGKRVPFEHPTDGIPDAGAMQGEWTPETIINVLQEFDRTTPSSKARSQGTYRGVLADHPDWPAVSSVIRHGGWAKLMGEARARNQQ